MKLDRRDFLKVVSFAALLPPLTHLRFLRFLESFEGLGGFSKQGFAELMEFRPTHCSLCSTVCDVVMHVRKVGDFEKIVKIDGNPRSPINRGKTCARGQSGLRRMYNPNRLKQPLIRVEGSRRGEWAFRPASWEEAYDYIMKRIQEEEIKPYEMVLYGGMIACAFYRPYFLAFALTAGIPNIIAPTLQNCVLGEHFGIATLTGNFNVHDELLADYENAAVTLVVASNASIAGISTSRAVRLGRAIDNGMKLIVLDPRLSETAAKAHIWLPVKPGTDLAFILALINKLIKESKYDKEFLRYYTNAPFLFYVDKTPPEPVAELDENGGFKVFYVYDGKSEEVKKVPKYINSNERTSDGELIVPLLELPDGFKFNGRTVKTAFQLLKEKVKNYTLEWAAKVMDVPFHKVAEAADLFVNQRPALVEPGWYDSRFDATFQLRKACAILQTLVGGFDRPGGWIFSGEYREHLKQFWENYKKGVLPKVPLQLPGIMAPYTACRKVFCNEKFWPHGLSSVPQAWIQQQREMNKPGVAFPLFSDIGYLDSVEGRLKWNNEPYIIKAMFILAGNPIRSGVDGKMWERILTHSNMKLVVVSDILPSDTALYADVILPDLSYLEKFDPVYTLAPSSAIGFRLRNPVKPISSNLKHMIDLFFDLSKRFGNFEKFVGMLSTLFSMNPEETMKRVEEAYSRGESPAKAFFEYHAETIAEHIGMDSSEFRSRLKSDGVIILREEWETVEEDSIPVKLPAPTPSGRLEIYSLLMYDIIKRCGHYRPNCDPVATYIPPKWKEGMNPEDKPDYSRGEFFLAFGKIPLMSYTSTADIDLLGALIDKVGAKMHHLWINRRVAETLGIREGDLVEVVNNLNSEYRVRVRAHLTEGIRPDTVFLPSSFGQVSPAWREVGDKGAPLNMLIPYRIGVVTGVYKAEEFTVTVRKVEEVGA